MSTHATSADLKKDPLVPHPTEPGHMSGTVPIEPRAGIPMGLWVAFGVVIVIGAALIFGRDRMAENATFDAMKDCEAKVKSDWGERGDDGNYVQARYSGVGDLYAVVRINKERESIASLFSLCDRADPVMGLRLFRRALTEGNKSAKLVALSCVNYLAHSQTTPVPQALKGVIEAEDINRIVDELDLKKEPELEVRKVALRALSDVTIITNAEAIAAITASSKAETRYSTISDAIRTAAKEGQEADAGKEPLEREKEARDHSRDIKIAVRQDNLFGKPVLLIRWSTPSLALAWWKEFAKDGKWDKDMQRFVIP